MAQTGTLTLVFRIRHGWLLTVAKPPMWLAYQWSPGACARIGNAVLRIAPIQYQDKRGCWRNTQQPRFVVTDNTRGVRLDRPWE